MFKGVKKGSLRDSNADSKSPPRVCDYYNVIKKIPTKYKTTQSQYKTKKKKKSHGKSSCLLCWRSQAVPCEWSQHYTNMHVMLLSGKFQPPLKGALREVLEININVKPKNREGIWKMENAQEDL